MSQRPWGWARVSSRCLISTAAAFVQCLAWGGKDQIPSPAFEIFSIVNSYCQGGYKGALEVSGVRALMKMRHCDSWWWVSTRSVFFLRRLSGVELSEDAIEIIVPRLLPLNRTTGTYLPSSSFQYSNCSTTIAAKGESVCLDDDRCSLSRIRQWHNKQTPPPSLLEEVELQGSSLHQQTSLYITRGPGLFPSRAWMQRPPSSTGALRRHPAACVFDEQTSLLLR